MRTIAHISDLHFGKLDRPVAEALVKDLEKLHPSLLVVSGDFTQRARRGQYKAAAAFLKRLPTPQLVVPGNHDIPMFDVLRRFLAPLSFYKKYITDNLSPFYQDAEMFVLGINSARSFTHKSGWISSEQMAELKARLCDLPATMVKVVVTHHPFVPPARDPKADVILRGEKYLDRMSDCGVDLLLAGHLHLAYHDDLRSHYKAARRSILSIQAGTATSTRRRHEPNAYNLITVSPDLCTVSVRAWCDGKFEQSLVTRYERIDGAWKKQAAVPVDSAAEASLAKAPAAKGAEVGAAGT